MANEKTFDTVYLFFYLLVAEDQCKYLERKQQNEIFMRIGLEKSLGSIYSLYNVFIWVLQC